MIESLDRLSESEMSQFSIAVTNISETKYFFLYDNIYKRWSKSIKYFFKRHSDPNMSSKMYLGNFEKSLCLQETPFRLGIITSFGANSVIQYRVEEFFIYSTLKTNQDILNFFKILFSCFGTGFPLVYMFF